MLCQINQQLGVLIFFLPICQFSGKNAIVKLIINCFLAIKMETTEQRRPFKTPRHKQLSSHEEDIQLVLARWGFTAAGYLQGDAVLIR